MSYTSTKTKEPLVWNQKYISLLGSLPPSDFMFHFITWGFFKNPPSVFFFFCYDISIGWCWQSQSAWFKPARSSVDCYKPDHHIWFQSITSCWTFSISTRITSCCFQLCVQVFQVMCFFSWKQNVMNSPHYLNPVCWLPNSRVQFISRSREKPVESNSQVSRW